MTNTVPLAALLSDLARRTPDNVILTHISAKNEDIDSGLEVRGLIRSERDPAVRLVSSFKSSPLLRKLSLASLSRRDASLFEFRLDGVPYLLAPEDQ